jgi:hypothetical protein
MVAIQNKDHARRCLLLSFFILGGVAIGLTKVTCFGSLSPFRGGAESFLLVLFLFFLGPLFLKVDDVVLDTGGGWRFAGLATSGPVFASVMGVVDAAAPPLLSSPS